MEEFPPVSRPWYKQYWGKILIFLSFLIGIFLFIFVFFTVKYFLQIRRGEEINLEGGWNKNFSEVNKATSKEQIEDRAKLETASSSFFGKVQGTVNAPLTVVFFYDYKCPNSKAALPIIQQFVSRNASKVRVIYRDFPSGAYGSGSGYLSKIAYCAGKQNRFPKMNQLLFDLQDQLGAEITADQLDLLSRESDIDRTVLDDCLSASSTEKNISEDYFLGVGAGVRGTPTFFANGRKIEGTAPLEVWEALLKQTIK